MKKHLTKILILFLILGNISCDQVSKKIVRSNVKQGEYIKLINDNFILTNVENTGAALGFGQNFNPLAKTILLKMLPLLVLFLLAFRILTKKHMNKFLAIAFAFVIGGGIGNLIDRIVYGSVTDFFHLRIGFFKTGIFNMADVSVTIGILMVLVLAWGKKSTEIA
ncbi:signal peptidase II [Flagellimonas pelagia]|uniref:Lipoprotein signal peptidase n=1 Tax=Flagellimonas pelagia TaxID=2306998 RepID=A0A3A1NI17_9FLAO|nr:signal peptidase II [Allomuricauda maritima]RIV41983.1 signal peptidase II [Allomuricauda maritima]TXJ90862.1 signal peptidase II [Allomuricauda maritima]